MLENPEIKVSRIDNDETLECLQFEIDALVPESQAAQLPDRPILTKYRLKMLPSAEAEQVSSMDK